MASSYQAKIDLIVSGLEKLKTAETRIKNLLRESKKLERGGTAQRGTVALAAVTRTERQASQRSIRAAERKLALQSQLNAATDLYNRKLGEFARAGGSANKELKGRVDQIKQAFQAGTRGGQKNIRLARALATELGRVVEKQRESNRLQALRNKGIEESSRGFKRIDALKAGGSSDTRGIARAETLVAQVAGAGKTGDQALYNEAVRKAKAVLNRLEAQYQESIAAHKSSVKAKRDVEAAEKRLARETKDLANERDRAARKVKAQTDRDARKAKADAAASKRARKQKLTDIGTGIGFPLLFGGGPGSVIGGGIGGALGGLGGSVFFGALGQQLDQAVQAANTFAIEVTKAGTAASTLAEKFGIVGTGQAGTIGFAETLGIGGAARSTVESSLAGIVGEQGVENLKELGRSAQDSANALSRFGAATTAAFAPLLTGLNDLTAGLFGGISKPAQLTRARENLEAGPGKQTSSLGFESLGFQILPAQIKQLEKDPEVKAFLELEKQINQVILDRTN